MGKKPSKTIVFIDNHLRKINSFQTFPVSDICDLKIRKQRCNTKIEKTNWVNLSDVKKQRMYLNEVMKEILLLSVEKS